MVVDATESEGPIGPDGPGIRVDLTVLGGAHKGELITMTAVGLQRDPLDLLAVPGTLVVDQGNPQLTLEG